ncbi:hypothetical protein PHLCEN_2v10899 [Hermanssonia centrifuga]|uniref:Uncharacterized protein n=1 Tax=Hermanssonia centrifuga TaxID=98765 RepID=A0A2R6NLH6_9APHY|nr:hypothetical protein PHLCEN_2v10899 [Hermanssonia centrifuga]
MAKQFERPSGDGGPASPDRSFGVLPPESYRRQNNALVLFWALQIRNVLFDFASNLLAFHTMSSSSFIKEVTTFSQTSSDESAVP